MNIGQIFVLEGGECSGKTTIARYLESQIDNMVYLREPGGNEVCEKIREVIVNNEMSPWAELLLFMASRADLIENTIKPLILSGKNVILDRFHLSSMVYQGAVRGIGYENVLDMHVDLFRKMGIFEINKIYVIDSDIETYQKRSFGREGNNKFERYDLDFHERIFTEYRNLAEASIFIQLVDGRVDSAKDIIKDDILVRLSMEEERKKEYKCFNGLY